MRLTIAAEFEAKYYDNVISIINFKSDNVTRDEMLEYFFNFLNSLGYVTDDDEFFERV